MLLHSKKLLLALILTSSSLVMTDVSAEVIKCPESFSVHKQSRVGNCQYMGPHSYADWCIIDGWAGRIQGDEDSKNEFATFKGATQDYQGKKIAWIPACKFKVTGKNMTPTTAYLHHPNVGKGCMMTTDKTGWQCP